MGSHLSAPISPPPHSFPTTLQGRQASSAAVFRVSSRWRGVYELALSSLRSSPTEESRAVWKSPVSLPSRNLTSLSPSSTDVARDG